VVALRDIRAHKVAMQVQLEMLRFCANTTLIYFLRVMPLAATLAAAECHDQLIAAAFHEVVCSHAADRSDGDWP
jgi:hypothetical protein